MSIEKPGGSGNDKRERTDRLLDDNPERDKFFDAISDRVNAVGLSLDASFKDGMDALWDVYDATKGDASLVTDDLIREVYLKNGITPRSARSNPQE
jgi:hypothetical protein